MMTAVLIAVAVVAVLATVGGVSMMWGASGKCVLSWWMGYNALRAGCEVLAAVVPALVEAVVESGK